jgi:hypothetical protein
MQPNTPKQQNELETGERPFLGIPTTAVRSPSMNQKCAHCEI